VALPSLPQEAEKGLSQAPATAPGWEMWRFYGRVLVSAPRALWDASDWWARIIELALIAGILVPGLADLFRDTVTANLYWITLASFLALVLFGMLRANYQSVRVAEERAAASEAEVQRAKGVISGLQQKIAPRLGVSLDEVRPSPDGTRRFVRLRVVNEGHEEAVGCHGKLLDVRRLHGVRVPLPEPGQNLTWSSRGSEPPGLRRSIAPGSHEYLDVAFADDFLDEWNAGKIERTGQINARVRQLLDDQGRSSFYFVFLDWRAWRLPPGAYDVTIEVAAANVGTPTPICFRLVYEGGLDLHADS
jgi:hypothetical protein